MVKSKLLTPWLEQQQDSGSSNCVGYKVYVMLCLRANKHYQPAPIELSCRLPYDSRQDFIQILPHGGVSKTILLGELLKSFL